MPPSGRTPTGGDPSRRNPSPAGLLIGRVLAVVGLICVPAGLYLISVATEAAGIVLGVVGYFPGARRIGTVTIVLAPLAMIYGVLTQGYLTGPGS